MSILSISFTPPISNCAATTSEVNDLSSQLDQGQATRESLTSQLRAGEEFRAVCTVWLRQSYRDMLSREIDAGEINGWMTYLQGTGSQSAVVNAIVTSQEHRQVQWSGWVRDVYQTYLRRAAGTNEVGYWTGHFQAGWTKDSLVGAVVSSGEYQSRVGDSNSQFVAALYQDMLGRTAGSSEISGWASALDKGATRSSVVSGFLGSFEYRRRQNWQWSADLYSSCLGRPADTQELTSLVGALSAGATYDAITLGVLTSQEYYNRAARG